jgi:hypothetical protein
VLGGVVDEVVEVGVVVEVVDVVVVVGRSATAGGSWYW